MSVNISKLLDWPDAASLERAAEDLKRHGGEFSDTVDDARQAWFGLNTHYDSPHQYMLYQSFAPASTAADAVRAGTSAAARPLITFAATLNSLAGERRDLLKEARTLRPGPQDPVENFVNPDWGPEDVLKARENDLQQRIDRLAQVYARAVEECVSDLSCIDSSGKVGPPPTPHPVPDRSHDNLWLDGAGALAEGRRTLKLQFKTPDGWKTIVKSSWWDGGHHQQSGNFADRFKTNFREQFLGPKSEVVHVEDGGDKVRGVKSVSTLGRVAGRGLFVLGAGITFGSEYSQAQEKLKQEDPGLSDEERNAKATEKAAVRTGSQLAASAAAGAAVGSLLPVGGTVVGLAVGAGVGLAMSVNTGGGKTAGDRIADVGETVWNFGKKTWEKVFG